MPRRSFNPLSIMVIILLTILAGAGFQNGAVVTFEGGQGLPQQVVSVQVVDPGTIINPDNSTAVLVAAFTVAPAP